MVKPFMTNKGGITIDDICICREKDKSMIVKNEKEKFHINANYTHYMSHHISISITLTLWKQHLNLSRLLWREPLRPDPYRETVN